MNQGCEDGFEASRVRCRVTRIDVCVGRPLGDWRKVSIKFLGILRLGRRKKEGYIKVACSDEFCWVRDVAKVGRHMKWRRDVRGDMKVVVRVKGLSCHARTSIALCISFALGFQGRTHICLRISQATDPN